MTYFFPDIRLHVSLKYHSSGDLGLLDPEKSYQNLKFYLRGEVWKADLPRLTICQYYSGGLCVQQFHPTKQELDLLLPFGLAPPLGQR